MAARRRRARHRAPSRRRGPGGLGGGPGGPGGCRGTAARRLGRARGARHQPQRVPVVRARLPRPRRGRRPAGAARRARRLAGGAVPRVSADDRLRRLLALPGSDPSGPLARGLAKLARAVGVDPDEALEIEMNPVPTEVIDTMRRAVSERRQVEMEYYSFGRDSAATRVIDPYSVFAASGQWYVAAFCHTVDDERLFRLDRVRRATPLDATFAAPTVTPDLTVYEPQPDDPRVELDLEPGARWVIEQYPVEGVEGRPGGGWRVRLVASERAWLERLLLRLGTDARVVDGPVEAASEAAGRLLSRYR